MSGYTILKEGEFPLVYTCRHSQKRGNAVASFEDLYRLPAWFQTILEAVRQGDFDKKIIRHHKDAVCRTLRLFPERDTGKIYHLLLFICPKGDRKAAKSGVNTR